MIKIKSEISLTADHYALTFPMQIGHVLVLWPILCFAWCILTVIWSDIKGLLSVLLGHFVRCSKLKASVLGVAIQGHSGLSCAKCGKKIYLKGFLVTYAKSQFSFFVYEDSSIINSPCNFTFDARLVLRSALVNDFLVGLITSFAMPCIHAD